MNSYRIMLKKRAKQFLDHVSGDIRKRLLEAIEKLPFEGDIKKMKGHEALYRLRVGEYRIIYTVDHGELIIMVIDVDVRGSIYKRY